MELPPFACQSATTVAVTPRTWAGGRRAARGAVRADACAVHTPPASSRQDVGPSREANALTLSTPSAPTSDARGDTPEMWRLLTCSAGIGGTDGCSFTGMHRGQHA
jgi:hypothetical protein